MAYVHKHKFSTRLKIVQLAARLFIEQGYTNTSAGKIGKALNLSTGNITFYFPSKDHLLSVVVEELFAFQDMMMHHAAEEGQSSLLAYCLELTAITSICAEDAVARNFYTSAYTAPITLEHIRLNDTEKTREVFKSFCPDWTDTDWLATENIVSGIEYSAITANNETIPLDVQITKTLDSIMLLYGVPESIRQTKINKVLSMDYRSLGRRILGEFKEYIEEVNEQNLKNSVNQKRPYRRKPKSDSEIDDSTAELE